MVTKNALLKQKEEIEAKIKEIEEDEKLKLDKVKWLYIPELKIEVQTKIHGFNKTLAESMKELKENEKVITYEQLQWLRNSKYATRLNLMKTWEFVYPNPDKMMSEKGYVARFVAGSYLANLDCIWDPSSSVPTLGVRFVRPIKRRMK